MAKPPPQQSGPVYTNAAPAHIAGNANSAVIGTGEFTLMELIARIPIVNLVMFCVWGFSGDTNENKRNWARSRLIWLGIGVGLAIIGTLVGRLLKVDGKTGTLIGVGMASAIASGFSNVTDAIFY